MEWVLGVRSPAVVSLLRNWKDGKAGASSEGKEQEGREGSGRALVVEAFVEAMDRERVREEERQRVRAVEQAAEMSGLLECTRVTLSEGDTLYIPKGMIRVADVASPPHGQQSIDPI